MMTLCCLCVLLVSMCDDDIMLSVCPASELDSE